MKKPPTFSEIMPFVPDSLVLWTWKRLLEKTELVWKRDDESEKFRNREYSKADREYRDGD
jgi:hypothetical protein